MATRREIPRQPHSEFAAGLVDTLKLGVVQRVGDWGATLIDGAVAPIREALEGVSNFTLADGSHCWCYAKLPHEDWCQRARAVYESLKVKE